MTDPVAAYRAALGHPEAFEFPIHALDRLQVPVYSTASWTADGVFCNGVGYGIDDDAARASAWGELAESALAHTGLPEPVMGSYADLLRERPVLDPRWSPLPAGSTWRPADERPWCVAESAGGEVLVPYELAATRHADFPDGVEPLFTPVTNGLGAGLTRERALAHAVGELLQRDGNSVSYRALDRGVAVDLDGLADPIARELLERYDDAGVTVTVKLAGISCGVASVYVVGHDRDPADAPHVLCLSAAGEAAHPRREVAIRKALLEFAASRARRFFSHAPFEQIGHLLPGGYADRFRAQPLGSEEDRSLRATQALAALSPAATMELLAPVFAVRERVPLAALPDDAATPVDPLWIPFADGEVTAGKAFVPGLEVESLSYGRVGPRNLRRLLTARAPFVGLGPPPAGARRLPLVTETAAWLDPERMDAAVGALYALYREPGRHVAALAAERA